MLCCRFLQTIPTHLQLAGSPQKCGTQTVREMCLAMAQSVQPFYDSTTLQCTMMGVYAFPYFTVLVMTPMDMKLPQSDGHQFSR